MFPLLRDELSGGWTPLSRQLGPTSFLRRCLRPPLWLPAPEILSLAILLPVGFFSILYNLLPQNLFLRIADPNLGEEGGRRETFGTLQSLDFVLKVMWSH